MARMRELNVCWHKVMQKIILETPFKCTLIPANVTQTDRAIKVRQYSSLSHHWYDCKVLGLIQGFVSVNLIFHTVCDRSWTIVQDQQYCNKLVLSRFSIEPSNEHISGNHNNILEFTFDNIWGQYLLTYGIYYTQRRRVIHKWTERRIIRRYKYQVRPWSLSLPDTPAIT